MYTIIDLLDKIIQIETRGFEMYEYISLRTDIDPKIKTVARILALEEKRHAKMYTHIKNKIPLGELTPIDFDIYDQASKLINNFRTPDAQYLASIEELLRFASDFEKQSISLVLSIQGLLVREAEDSDSITYKTLSEIIKEEEKHIENIENFLH